MFWQSSSRLGQIEYNLLKDSEDRVCYKWHLVVSNRINMYVSIQPRSGYLGKWWVMAILTHLSQKKRNQLNYLLQTRGNHTPSSIKVFPKKRRWWTQSDLAFRFNLSGACASCFEGFQGKPSECMSYKQTNISYLNINHNSHNGSYDGHMWIVGDFVWLSGVETLSNQERVWRWYIPNIQIQNTSSATWNLERL